MRDQFTLTQDPGHGWLIVTVGEISALGLVEADFSPFSYRMGARVALEEDLDAGTFLNAYRAAYDHAPLINVDHHGDRVRSWPTYGTKAMEWGNVT